MVVVAKAGKQWGTKFGSEELTQSLAAQLRRLQQLEEHSRVYQEMLAAADRRHRDDVMPARRADVIPVE